MTPSEFSDLLKRYRDGLATPEEIRKLDEWYDYIGQETENLDVGESKKRKQRSLVNIMAEKPVSDPSQKPATLRFIIAYGTVAASLAIAFLFFYYKFEASSVEEVVEARIPQDQMTSKIQHFSNTSEHNRLIVLPDGSGVLLSPGSSLVCHESFGGTDRKTKLTGDAFFEIAHDETRPFYVLCGEIVTRVLGTSFWVKSSQKSKSVEVEVHTGKVSVFKKTNKKDQAENTEMEAGVTLLAKQRAYFSTQHKADKVKLVYSKTEPALVSKPKQNYNFQDTPLASVFHSISSEYGLKILLNIPEPTECTFTGDINGLTLIEKLEIICFSTGTTFKINESLLVIDGKGCH